MLRNVVKLESITDPTGPIEAILRRCNKEQVWICKLTWLLLVLSFALFQNKFHLVSWLQLMIRYVIPKFETTLEFLQHLARRQGRLKKGGIPDSDAAAKIVLQDWLDGRLSYYTMPPAVHSMPAHLSSTVVGELSQEFDIDALMSEERLVLDSLPSSKV